MLLTAIMTRLRRERAANDPDVAREKRIRPAAPYPVGRWRCTRAADHVTEYFTPGQTYVARLDPGRTVVRIHHGKGGLWAPIFDHDADRFRCASHDLDFEYLGAE